MKPEILINKRPLEIIVNILLDARLAGKRDNKALDIFNAAYDEHKAEHGSYKHLTGKEYTDAMRERLGYQLTVTYDYIGGA